MYENINYENIKTNILSRINGIDKREGSFVNDMVSPVSMELEEQYGELDGIYRMFFLDNLTSTELEGKCNEYGLTRKNGTYASGVVTFTGTTGTVIPKGSLISTITGISFVTTEEKTIVANTADIPIKAVDVGTLYNIEANMINTINVGITGVVSVANTAKTTGGTNVESDDELLNRLLLYLRTPVTSGNAEHYKMWAMEVAGIGNAKPFPLWNGNGTVQVLPITTDFKAPNTELINNVVSHIEAKRPVGATVTVTAPIEVAINVTATLTLKLNYALDIVKEEYKKQLDKYIKDSVFKLNTVDYNRCLSIFYGIEGVESVTNFMINSGIKNITIEDKQIQVLGTITIN